MCDELIFPSVGRRNASWVFCVFLFFCWIATGVFSLVLTTIGFALMVPNYRPWKLSNPKLEMWWSLGPLILILVILIPSTVILYLREANFFPVGGVKVIGHQWY